MKHKRHTPEQIIHKLRTAEQLLNQDQSVADVCRALEWGSTETVDTSVGPVT